VAPVALCATTSVALPVALTVVVRVAVLVALPIVWRIVSGVAVWVALHPIAGEPSDTPFAGLLDRDARVDFGVARGPKELMV